MSKTAETTLELGANGSELFSLTNNGNDWTFSAGESLTIYEVQKIKDAFVSHWHGGQSYTVDCSKLKEIDTAGIQLLLAMANKVVGSEGRWNISSISEVASEILNLYNLEAFSCASLVEKTEKYQ